MASLRFKTGGMRRALDGRPWLERHRIRMRRSMCDFKLSLIRARWRVSKQSLKYMLISIALSLLATGCATRLEPSQPPIIQRPPDLPRPAATLMVSPLPQGAYLNPVLQWQREAEAKLTALPVSSAASKPTSTKSP